MRSSILVTVLLLTFVGTYAQKKFRVQPGKLYEPGDTLYAPKFGFTARVPEGWEGMLPREGEVFLLTTKTSTYGEVYIFGRESCSASVMAEAWTKGFDLNETIRLKAIQPVVKDDILSAEVVAEGQYINKGNKAFAITKFNPNGPCMTVLMVAPTQYYESVKNTVTQFIANSSFEAPSNASPYDNFDWRKFLSNKLLITYAAPEGGTKETKVHLCADGTFTAYIKKAGFFKKQNPDYRGQLTGTWTVNGNGKDAVIQFTFDKKNLSAFETQITIDDEKVYNNDERYFVGKSDKCK